MSFGIPLCGLLKSMARLSGRDQDPTPLGFSRCTEPWGFSQLSRWTLLSHVNILKLDHSSNTEKNWVTALISRTQGIWKWFAQRRGAGWEDKPTLHVQKGLGCAGPLGPSPQRRAAWAMGWGLQAPFSRPASSGDVGFMWMLRSVAFLPLCLHDQSSLSSCNQMGPCCVLQKLTLANDLPRPGGCRVSIVKLSRAHLRWGPRTLQTQAICLLWLNMGLKAAKRPIYPGIPRAAKCADAPGDMLKCRFLGPVPGSPTT